MAVARKLAVLAWHLLTKQQDYLYERPALTARKLRKLELTAGAPRRLNPGGRHGPASVDNPAQWKRERAAAFEHERQYVRLVEQWRPQGPAVKVGKEA